MTVINPSEKKVVKRTSVHCVLKLGFTWRFLGNYDATLEVMSVYVKGRFMYQNRLSKLHQLLFE